jgi:hypothetical protein
MGCTKSAGFDQQPQNGWAAGVPGPLHGDEDEDDEGTFVYNTDATADPYAVSGDAALVCSLDVTIFDL